jgi:4-hydroxy-tetrahydrodipicolinate reductase
MAKQANVTFTGGGIWDLSRIWAGIMVTSPCTEIRALHHVSVTDAQRTGAKLLPIVGVGLGIAEFNEKLVKAAGGVGGIYGTIPRHVLESIGYTVTSLTERREPVLFDEPIHCRLLDRDIPAGVCAGSRVVVEAETEEGVSFDARIEVRLLKDGEAEHMLWAVDGKPSSRIRVERDDSTHATASSLFNRIPDVIAARPGIVPISQLGPMRHTALNIGRRATLGGS